MSHAPDSAPKGAVHEQLSGGKAVFRFRPPRLEASELQDDVTCVFEHEGKQIGPVPVLDVGPWGLALDSATSAVLKAGTELDPVSIRYRERPIFEGSAVVVYRAERAGLRVTGHPIDVDALRMEDRMVDRRLSAELLRAKVGQKLLPADWRAAVGDLQQLLTGVKELLREAGEGAVATHWWRPADSRKLIERVWARWAPDFYAGLEALDELSTRLTPEAVEAGQAYATRMLMPLLMAGPMHRRAFEKPLGYAGDYRLMTFYFVEELEGQGWFGELLHYTSQRYALGHTVRAREKTMRDAVARAVSGGATRILSLASGPALELERYLWSVDSLPNPLTITLVDQDEEALDYANERLRRCLVERHRGRLPVELNCMHFSVKQLLKPQTDAEREVASEILSQQDLIYSAGLFDYLPEKVAGYLLSRLWTMVRPGGRLLIGNLERVPQTAWMMEYVLGWNLLYRTPNDMMRLGSLLARPAPKDLDITTDATGHCLFLDAKKPG
ncbi:MAG: extracellular factor (EF) 3-hydroxypalmitic acid methyl ester biosynthesis protein [Myxococcota bacterium]|jgi:extracellular factor (EF) 3-hydroxypalmitic acid methyl ester biosynthesis protein